MTFWISLILDQTFVLKRLVIYPRFPIKEEKFCWISDCETMIWSKISQESEMLLSQTFLSHILKGIIFLMENIRFNGFGQGNFHTYYKVRHLNLPCYYLCVWFILQRVYFSIHVLLLASERTWFFLHPSVTANDWQYIFFSIQNLLLIADLS
jgi:hypothetical protein